MPDHVDLEAVRCVEQHHWDDPVYGRAETGPLRGLPVRDQKCAVCKSTKREYLTWNGRVTARAYDLDPAYIDNARLLDDDVFARRYAYRRARIARALKPTSIEQRLMREQDT